MHGSRFRFRGSTTSSLRIEVKVMSEGCVSRVGEPVLVINHRTIVPLEEVIGEKINPFPLFEGRELRGIQIRCSVYSRNSLIGCVHLSVIKVS